MNTSNYDPKTKDLEYNNSTTFSNARFGELVKRVSALESSDSGSGCECVLGWQKLYEGTVSDEDYYDNTWKAYIKLITSTDLNGVYDEYYFTFTKTQDTLGIEVYIFNDIQNDPFGCNMAYLPLSEDYNPDTKYVYLTNLTNDSTNIGIIYNENCNNNYNNNTNSYDDNILDDIAYYSIKRGLFFDKVHFVLCFYASDFFPLGTEIKIYGRKKIANAVNSNFSLQDALSFLKES